MFIKPIVPVYKPREKELDNLIEALPKDFLTPLLIVSNVDRKELLSLEAKASNHEIELFFISNQIGKAETIRLGIEYCLENIYPDIIVQLDARNKQDISELSIMVGKMVEQGADMIVANRYARQNLANQSHRASISIFFAKIIEHLTGYKLEDTACGTRAYTSSLARKFVYLRSFGYGLELEQLIISSINNKIITDFPVHSNLQAHGTNAEKIEDNLMAIIAYMSDLKADKYVRNIMCYILTMVKKRVSFIAEFPPEYIIPGISFNYTGSHKIREGYTNQTLMDGYTVNLLSTFR